MRGLVVLALPMPEIAAQRVAASPFGADGTGQWSLPALGLGSIAAALLEPDPAVDWDEDRIASVRQALVSLTLPGA